MGVYMIETVEKFLKANIKTKQPLVVGVSTGIDSMVLLDILVKLSYDVVVAHINHGKRKQSLDEEAFIIDYCNQHNLNFRIKRLHEVDFVKGNFQELARGYRYHFFKEVADEFNTNYLCLAHHLNDDIETMMMRIIRGSSLKGYSGISEITAVMGMTVLRPLLKVLKKDIFDYANANNIIYFNDETNDEDAYTRNQIRHHIIPEIEKINDKFYMQFQEFKDHIYGAANAIERIRDDFIKTKVDRDQAGVEFKCTDFKKLDEYMQVEVLFELVASYKYSKANILELIKLINSDKKNLRIVYKGLTLIKEYNDINIAFSVKEKTDVNILIDGIGVYDVNDKYQLIVSKKNRNSDANSIKVWYNSSMLPVIARSRRAGDKIVFDYGTKKVKKVLIDNKVGISKRDEVIVLDKDDEILAIIGYGISSKLKTIEHDIIIELKEKTNDY